MRRPLPGGRTVRAILALMLVLATAGVPGTSPVGADNLSSRIAGARQRQSELRRSIDRQNKLLAELRHDEGLASSALGSSRDQLNSLNADQRTIRREISQAATAIARVQARRNALRGELRRLDWTLELLEQEIAAGVEELNARRRLLGTRLAEAYRTQNTSLLEQLVVEGSFTETLTNANAYLSYGDEDARLARGIAADQAALDSVRASTASLRWRTDQLRRATRTSEAELRDQQARLAEARRLSRELEAKVKVLRSRQFAAFRKVNRNRRQTQREVAAAAAASRRLDAQIADMVAEAQRRAEARRRAERDRGRGGGGRLPDGNGRFAWPTSGYVTQEFGCTGFPWEPRRGSCSHFHDGIDIANGSGTSVRAADDGVVAYVGWEPYDNSDPSYVVVIGHSGGFTTYYGHLQSRAVVRRGQSVDRGQLIGYMGNTGNSTGPHLHWEVRRGGRFLNPRLYV
jgi:murein DD-endopeptidase MepM/ murein hydrolase activator NlpD